MNTDNPIFTVVLMFMLGVIAGSLWVISMVLRDILVALQ